MKRRTTLGLAVTSLVMLSVAAVPAQRAAQGAAPQGWRGTVPAGATIEIKGVNGEIRAAAATGAEVEVSAEMKGRRSNPADVRLDIVQHADGVTICAMYPSPDGRANECQPGDGGRMNVRDNDVTVTFTVRVPAGVRFSGRTVNGDVVAEGLDGPVWIQTVNGDATFSTASHGGASTVNGSVHGTMGSATWPETMKIHTVNGSVSLDLPADTSTDLRATTVNGSITSDFPVTVTGRVGRQRLNGTIGGGGRALQIETVNGSITLRKRS
jgi:putative adhesin